jgi:hypothetical protein
VVAIKGIDPEYFFDFEEVLRTEFSLIEQVFTTASTHTRNVHGHYLGRYNLLCRTEHFVELAKALHDELSPLESNMQSRSMQWNLLTVCF